MLEAGEGIAVPYAGGLLAGLGAEVVKVEPPGRGDRVRHEGPFPDDQPDPEASGLFHYLNAGKRSLALDLTGEAGRATFRRLLLDFDLALLDGPGDLARALRADADLFASGTSVICVSPFGLDGPYADYASSEIVAQALMGLLYITGEPDREPVRIGVPLTQYVAGQTAAAAALTAYLHRQRGGAGDFVDLSIQEAAVAIMEFVGPAWQYRHEVYPRRGNWVSAAWGLYPVEDGHVAIIGGNGPVWQRFRRLIGGFLLDERAGDTSSRLTHADAINVSLLRWLEGKKKEEVYHEGQRHRVPFSYLATAKDILESAHLRERGFWVEGQLPNGRRFPMPGAPFRLDAAPWRTGPAPQLGSDDGRWTTDDGPGRGSLLPPGEGQGEGAPPVPSSVVDRPSSDHSPLITHPSPLPLSGIRVIDLGIVWAGPHCTRILADMGAEVIKVESARRPDSIRGPARANPHSGHYPDYEPGERPWNRHGYFNERNRNKLGICLDLTREEGRAVLRDLVRVSDVILDNFSVGVMDRLGFGAAAVRALNPAIVSISMSALGATGPEAGYTGYGATIDNLSGLVSVTGYGPDEPENLGINISDPVSGLHGYVAVLAALSQRARTGRGGHIDLSQRESSTRFFARELIDYSLNGRVAGPAGNDDPTTLLQGVFPCAPVPERPGGEPASADQWLALTIPDRPAWEAVKALLGLEVADEAALLADRAALRRRIAERTAAWPALELMAALQRRGVPAGAVHDAPRLFADAQLRHRGFFERITHPEAGTHDYIGLAWKFDRQPRRPARPAPLLGEHTTYVLESILGYPPEKIARLAACGVTANDPRSL